MSKGEQLIRETLDKLRINYKREYSVKHNNNNYRFDFALIDNNELIGFIEFHGEQHFSYNEFFFKEEREFTQAIKRDSEKLVIAQGLGIPLLIIKHKANDNSIIKVIKDFIIKAQQYKQNSKHPTIIHKTVHKLSEFTQNDYSFNELSSLLALPKKRLYQKGFFSKDDLVFTKEQKNKREKRIELLDVLAFLIKKRELINDFSEKESLIIEFNENELRELFSSRFDKEKTKTPQTEQSLIVFANEGIMESGLVELTKTHPELINKPELLVDNSLYSLMKRILFGGHKRVILYKKGFDEESLKELASITTPDKTLYFL